MLHAKKKKKLPVFGEKYSTFALEFQQVFTESLSAWCLRSTGLLLLGVLGCSAALQAPCSCSALEGSADSGFLKPEPSHSGSGNFKEKIISSVVPVEDSSGSRLVFQSCAEHSPLFLASGNHGED